MTNKTKYTPGPWNVISWPGVKICGTFIIEPWSKKELDSVNRYYADFCGRSDEAYMQAGLMVERKANASLISAAPDMYEALKNILNGINTGAITSDHDETFANAIQQARAAIAKAEDI